LGARVGPRRRGSALALVLCAFVPGCGGSPTSTREALHRLPLKLAPGAAPIEPAEAVERFSLVEGDELGRWELDSPTVRTGAAGGAARVPVVMLAAGPSDAEITVTRRGDFDLDAFDHIEVMATFDGHGLLAADFLRGGLVLGSTGFVPLAERENPGPTLLEVPEELADEGTFDALALRCSGGVRRLGMRRVVLLSRPVARHLPDPDQGERLVRVGSEWRRGVGVVAGREVLAVLRVLAGARVGFAYGQPARLSRPTTLVLRVTDGEQVLDEERYAVDGGEAWRQSVVSLHRWAGREVQLRFSVDDEAAGCALAETLAWTDAEAPSTVVLVTSHAHRGDHLSFVYRGIDIETPVLDDLAARGAVFVDAFGATTFTAPALAALHTGTHPRDTGLIDDAHALAVEAPTLAERFAASGYVTMASVGARNLDPRTSGLGQGFDRIRAPREDFLEPSAEVVARATGWLDELSGRPAFLWLHLTDAGWPHDPPADLLELYYDPRDDPRDPKLRRPKVYVRTLPLPWQDLLDVSWPAALYKAEISELDRELGALLDHPRAAAGTVAFVGDHGLARGEHGIWYKHLGLYPGVLHVPLVVAGPGVAPARIETPVATLDLGRTLLDLAGLASRDFPGDDLLVSARRGEGAPRFALEGNGMAASVTEDGLHLVLNLVKRNILHTPERREEHQVELYDLSEDWRAEHDLVDERPEDAARLRALLVDWLMAVPRHDWTRGAVIDSGLTEQRVQLGYVGRHPQTPEVLWQDDACEWCQRFP